MVPHFSNSSSFGFGHFDALDPFVPVFNGFDEVSRGGSMAFVSQALVLDSEKGELVNAPTTRVGKKEVTEAKALAALKSHSEAERRRRERINAHLATLRSLVPCTDKMDKATLLAEVINQVKMLKQNAMEASKGLLIPMDDDEVKVEPSPAGNRAALTFKASLSCECRPELMTDIRQAIDSLQLKLVDVEISTLGGRLKYEFVLSKGESEGAVIEDANINGDKARQDFASCIHQALSSVLEKGNTLAEYMPRTTLSNKRRRFTYFDSSSSSS
ncbi:unnamed protein product [Linum trigynum]|uniref:BHLH domain-containing protein n=1 Tax=Linum trigynum TaxID=586398 RepID=A0AAV2ERI7_9ROSI